MAGRSDRQAAVSGMMAGVNGFMIFAIISFLVGYAMYTSLGSRLEYLVPIGIAVFLGVVTPVTVIAIRNETRLTRLKLISLFAETFGLPKEKLSTEKIEQSEAAGAVAGQAPPAKQQGTQSTSQKPPLEQFMLSFEFVKGKYYVDLDLTEGEELTLDKIPRFPMMVHADWMLLLCATPFIVASFFGAFLLFAPLIHIIDYNGSVKIPLWPSVLTLGGSPTLVIKTPALFVAQHANTVTIAALAFAGAYFYSVRLLLRSVSVFDLSPVTFLRCFAHVVLAVLLAVVIFRVTPSPEGVAKFVQDTATAWHIPEAKSDNAGKPAPSVNGAAPAAGQTAPAPAACAPAPVDPCRTSVSPGNGAAATSAGPDQTLFDTKAAVTAAREAGVPPATDGIGSFWLVLAFALGFMPDAALEYGLKKSGLIFKERYAILDAYTKTIPLTVLDGVDSFIAFRMEEANIFDVQNLATANPIMLHIESPFGIYQTIDWVAQAQLCTIVGPERFLALKMINIRTIFDLERGVTAKGVEDEIVKLIGATLLADCHRDMDCRYRFGMASTTQELAGEAEGLAQTRKGMSTAGVKKLVELMIDDLHVHRLRQIWLFIHWKLGVDSRNLDGIDDPTPT